MSTVVPFPAPLSNHRTPVAVEVIVCPVAGLWTAWLRLPSGRYGILERTPDRCHALADAHAYATRYGIPVSEISRPLAVVLDQSLPSRSRRGEISIWPDPKNSSRWVIDHTSASGDSAGLVGSAFSLGEAMALAREAASRLGATFAYPSDFGGAA